MLKTRLLTAVMAVTLVVALGYGLIRLFALRWEHGDVYPAYSTLRSDPLGARAFLESLEALPGLEVRRNYRPLQQLRPDEPVTLIYAGVARSSVWGNEELRHFESLIANGSRAVFTFAPADFLPESKRRKSDKPEKKETSTEDKPEQSDSKPASDNEETEKTKKESRRSRPAQISFAEVAQRWGFRFDVATGKRAGSFHGVAKMADSDPALESEVSWHSALRFTDLQPPWRVLYRAAEEPVLIERRWGDGTIVLASDSFFLSNEALLHERNPALLAWLIGPSRTVIFDEEHLGVAEATGLLSLARKYRLQGALAALALVGILWVWRQSVRFVPAYSSGRRSEEYVAGLDSHAGFVSLLRRSVPPARVIDVCLEEWRKTFSHDRQALAAVEQTLAESPAANAKKRDPVALYRTVAHALKSRKNR